MIRLQIITPACAKCAAFGASRDWEIETLWIGVSRVRVRVRVRGR